MSLLKSEGMIEDDVCLTELSEVLGQLTKLAANDSRTGKLWINYLEQVSLLRLFIRAERTGDWNLHLYCIRRMIPLFHAAGHIAYAKSARLYLHQMTQLESIMSEADYQQFTESGYFTIRRNDRFWGGTFTDQTIEQELMRLLKSSGG